MKRLCIIVSLLFLTVQLFSQTKPNFKNCEISISINRPNLNLENKEDRPGFGIGVNYPFFMDKKLNLVTGLEYNQSYQFMQSLYEGHFANATDVTFTMNCISVPVALRINFGKKTVPFIETGGFADFMVHSNMNGTMHTYIPDENNHVDYKEFQIDEDAGLTNSFGVYFGAGILVPVSKYHLLLKTAYKQGLNHVYSYVDEFNCSYFSLSAGIKFR
jgi:hypothetical protein